MAGVSCEAGDPRFEAWARQFGEPGGAPAARTSNTHDIGFIFYPSFALGYRDHRRRNARGCPPLQAARTLLTRFNPEGEYLQAWGPLDHPLARRSTAIDTMMNLPLLWWASRISGSQTSPTWPVRMPPPRPATTCGPTAPPTTSTPSIRTPGPVSKAALTRAQTRTPRGHAALPGDLRLDPGLPGAPGSHLPGSGREGRERFSRMPCPRTLSPHGISPTNSPQPRRTPQPQLSAPTPSSSSRRYTPTRHAVSTTSTWPRPCWPLSVETTSAETARQKKGFSCTPPIPCHTRTERIAP